MRSSGSPGTVMGGSWLIALDPLQSITSWRRSRLTTMNAAQLVQLSETCLGISATFGLAVTQS